VRVNLWGNGIVLRKIIFLLRRENKPPPFKGKENLPEIAKLVETKSPMP
jgi:hypothetical protein